MKQKENLKKGRSKNYCEVKPYEIQQRIKKRKKENFLK